MSAPEQFANLAETTLSAAYAAGSDVISVTSTSGFPTVGPFRVRIDNSAKTLFRVDWVYGSNFYGVAEANDGAASSSNAVVLVWTKGSAERVIQAPETGFLGDPMTAYAGVGGAQGYGPMVKLGGLDQSGWSWFNQGTSTIRQGGGLLELVAQSTGGTSVRGRFTTLPSRPFAVTIGIVPRFPPSTNLANLAGIGIAMYESGTTKFNAFFVANFDFTNGNPPPVFAWQQYATPTGGTGTLYAQKKAGTDFHAYAANTVLPPFGIVWLRYSDDGVNAKTEYSWDKINWNLMSAPQSRTTGFTTAPDSVAIVWTAQSASVSPALLGWITSYELAQPGYGTVPTGAAVLTGYQPGITIT